MLSSTVTVAVQVSVLPFESVTVSVTVLSPKSAQVKLVISKVIEAIEQSSDEPLSISAAVIVTLPVASNSAVKSWQTATGGVESMVTVAVAHTPGTTHPPSPRI